MFLTVDSLLGFQSPVFQAFPNAAHATTPNILSPSASVGGSPLHSAPAFVPQQQPVPRPAPNVAPPAKTPVESHADYSRTHFDSVFGRTDYSKLANSSCPTILSLISTISHIATDLLSKIQVKLLKFHKIPSNEFW